jgi:hypothetical protein
VQWLLVLDLQNGQWVSGAVQKDWWLANYHSPPTPIWATEVGSYFASIWPDTVVVAHYFGQIFAYFERKNTFLEVKWRLCH